MHTNEDCDEERNKSPNTTSITQTENMWQSHYDRDDRESVLMNLKDHKPKSAKGYSL